MPAKLMQSLLKEEKILLNPRVLPFSLKPHFLAHFEDFGQKKTNVFRNTFVILART